MGFPNPISSARSHPMSGVNSMSLAHARNSIAMISIVAGCLRICCLRGILGLGSPGRVRGRRRPPGTKGLGSLGRLPYRVFEVAESGSLERRSGEIV